MFVEEIVYLDEATFQATVISLMSQSSCASREAPLIIQLHVYNSLRLQAHSENPQTNRRKLIYERLQHYKIL